jgi:hypothetical protein
MAYEINYAESSGTEDIGLPPQLFAGDTPPVSTQDIEITTAAAIAQFVPLQQDGVTFAYEPWAAADGLPIAAVTAYAVPIGTTRNAVYTAGMFNIDAISWPATTTEAQVQAAQRGDCKFRKLLYSDKRTGNEGDPGTPAGPA